MLPRSWFTSPVCAAFIAVCLTCVFLYAKNKVDNNKSDLPVSYYAKPSLAVGILVAFIVYMGCETKEDLLKESFD